MKSTSVERSIWIAAPRERVWQAVTDPEHLAQWLLPPALGAQMKRDDSGTIYVCMGPMEIPFAVFEVIDPSRQVTMRGLPDRLITATCTLETGSDGTRVTVTMSGFESLPETAHQERIGPISMGWEKALENLKAHVDGTELPFPQGYVAALFGYRREGAKSFAVERSIWIDASRERVWQAVTDPEQIQQWFSPGTPWKISALEVGGRLYAPNAETGAEMYTQIIDVFDPPHQFVIRSVPELPETPQITTHILEEEKGGTRLTITNAGYELVADDARPGSMEQSAFGFGMMLENIQAFVAGKSLPYPQGF